MECYGLTPIESTQVSADAAETLQAWNTSKKHPCLGFLGARIVGIPTFVATGISDSVFHAICFSGKLIAGIVITPYNFVARRVAPDYCAPQDLELFSAFIHVIRLVENLIKTVILPLIVIFSPKIALRVSLYSMAGSRTGEKFQSDSNAIQPTLVSRKVKTEEHSSEKNELDALIEECNQTHKPLNTPQKKSLENQTFDQFLGEIERFLKEAPKPIRNVNRDEIIKQLDLELILLSSSQAENPIELKEHHRPHIEKLKNDSKALNNFYALIADFLQVSDSPKSDASKRKIQASKLANHPLTQTPVKKMAIEWTDEDRIHQIWYFKRIIQELKT